MSNNQFSGEINPFADPSIQNVTKNIQSLDDYNPFSQGSQQKPAAIISTSSTSTSAINSNINDTYQPTFQVPQAVTQPVMPPSYSTTSIQQVNLSDIEKQQQELDRRAAELERRERALSAPTTTKNFPPLPAWCPGPLKPCYYQDINVEIPIEFQRWVRMLFYLWIFHACTLAFNIIAALVVLITTNQFATFGFSILFFVLFTPMSYVCWFRPAYKAFRSDSSVNFMLFFFVFFCQIAINIVEAIGFQDSGFCGIVLMISVFSKGTAQGIAAGVFALITTLAFVAIAVSDILILMKIHALYRNTAASFEKAQAEFATNMMSNKNVQNAAVTVFKEGAKASMNQASSGGGSTGTSNGRF